MFVLCNTRIFAEMTNMLLIGIDHYEIKLFGIKIDQYCCPLGYAHFDAVEERSTYCCIRSEI